MVKRNAGIALIKTVIGSFILICIVIGLLVLFLQRQAAKMDTSASLPQATVPGTTVETQIKTYINTKYHYSISYPPTWTVKEYPDTKTGASFYNGDANDSKNMVASIDVLPKVGNAVAVPFETYVKTAASQEIQGYGKLQTIEKVTTTSGIVGYTTTWMVSPPPNMGAKTASAPSVSQPITYFPLPSNTTQTIQVSLSNASSLSDYTSMLQTFAYVK